MTNGNNETSRKYIRGSTVTINGLFGIPWDERMKDECSTGLFFFFFFELKVLFKMHKFNPGKLKPITEECYKPLTGTRNFFISSKAWLIREYASPGGANTSINTWSSSLKCAYLASPLFLSSSSYEKRVGFFF